MLNYWRTIKDLLFYDLRKKYGWVFFLVFLLLFIALLLYSFGSISSCYRTITLDNGQILNSKNKEIYPYQIPMRILASYGSNSDRRLFRKTITAAINEYNKTVYPNKLFIGGINEELYYRYQNEKLKKTGNVFITIRSLTYGITGITDLFVNDNVILHSENEINYDIDFDKILLRNAVMHTLGHAIGLADDEYSIDLRSCMSSKLPISCIISWNDKIVLKRYFSKNKNKIKFNKTFFEPLPSPSKQQFLFL
jgi:hypothetical protein